MGLESSSKVNLKTRAVETAIMDVADLMARKTVIFPLKWENQRITAQR
ncbi:hypothetical protein [Moorena producens]